MLPPPSLWHHAWSHTPARVSLALVVTKLASTGSRSLPKRPLLLFTVRVQASEYSVGDLVFGVTMFGGYSEQVVVPAKQLRLHTGRLAQSLSLYEAASLHPLPHPVCATGRVHSVCACVCVCVRERARACVCVGVCGWGGGGEDGGVGVGGGGGGGFAVPSTLFALVRGGALASPHTATTPWNPSDTAGVKHLMAMACV